MILNKTHFKFTTLNVQTNTLYFIQKRYNPGGGKGGKTIVEIAANTTKKGLDKCIGAGCIFETNATNTKSPSAPTSSSQQITANNNNNSKDYSTQINKEQHHAPQDISKSYDIQKPPQWLRDKVALQEVINDQSLPKKTQVYTNDIIENTNKELPTATSLGVTIKDNVAQDVANILKKTKMISLTQEIVNDMSSVDNFPLVQDPVGLPTIPPDPILPEIIAPLEIPDISINLGLDANNNLFKIPVPPPLPKYNIGSFLDQLVGLKPQDGSSNIKPSEVKEKLKALQDRGLLTYENNQEKLTKKYYKLPKEKTNRVIPLKVALTEEILINNNNFNVGLLQVTDNNTSIILKGTQTHVVVIYTIQNDQKIVIGFLTSNTDAKILLSEIQPFAFEGKHHNKQQYFAVLQEPLVITNTDDIKELETIILSGDIKINQQEVGKNYINQPHIKDIIQEQLIKQILPTIKQQGHCLQEYDGKGLTLNEIDYAIKAFDDEAEKKAQKFFEKYIKVKNKQDITQRIKWLKGQEQTLDKFTLVILKQKIQDYENKHNF